VQPLNRLSYLLKAAGRRFRARSVQCSFKGIWDTLSSPSALPWPPRSVCLGLAALPCWPRLAAGSDTSGLAVEALLLSEHGTVQHKHLSGVISPHRGRQPLLTLLWAQLAALCWPLDFF